MTIVEINKTAAVPTIKDDLAIARWRDIGPRAECYACDEIEECTTCGNDSGYHNPVAAGDFIFLQTKFTDQYNSDPENPQYGWYDGTANWFIKATIQFKSGPDIVLNAQPIISDAGVGFAGQSFQNLTLNASEILDAGSGECFRIKFETQKLAFDFEYTGVLGIGAIFPTGFIAEGALWIDGVNYYQYIGGSWLGLPGPIPNGTIVFTKKDGLFYELVAGVWTPYTPVKVPAAGPSCTTAWYEKALCEETVLIEGYHGSKDCKGSTYGIIETEYQYHPGYRDQYRVWASFECVGFPPEITKDEDDTLTKFVLRENWLMRSTRGWRKQIAEKVAHSFLAKNLFIEGNEYQNASAVEKKNDDGTEWWPEINVTRRNCESGNTCEDIVVYTPTNTHTCPDPSPADCEDVTILLNGDPYAIAAAGSIVDVIAATGPCDDARVSNSDDSYDVTVASGGDLEVPDSVITEVDGSTTANVPATQPYSCQWIAEDISFGEAAPAVIETLPGWEAVHDVTPFIPIAYVRPMPIGYATQFTDDDMYHAASKQMLEGKVPVIDMSNPNNLLTTNAFGNNRRFTNDLGGLTFDGSGGETPDYFIDHFTGLGYILDITAINYGANVSAADRAAVISGGSFAGFSGWRPAGAEEVTIFSYMNEVGSPGFLTGGPGLWPADIVTSSIDRLSGQMIALYKFSGFYGGGYATVTLPYAPVRNHY